MLSLAIRRRPSRTTKSRFMLTEQPTMNSPRTHSFDQRPSGSQSECPLHLRLASLCLAVMIRTHTNSRLPAACTGKVWRQSVGRPESTHTPSFLHRYQRSKGRRGSERQRAGPFAVSGKLNGPVLLHGALPDALHGFPHGSLKFRVGIDSK